MFEDKTYESIMDSLLSRVPNTYDKREGSVIWDALAPCAIELANIYIQMNSVLNETYADTASLFYLNKRCLERGISQKLATNAILKSEFTPSTLNIQIGARFSCDNLNYEVIQKLEDGVYEVKCEEVGSEGNKHFGQMIPIDYIEGLETANITEVLIPAEDDETVESLRERYFDSMRSQSFGGNIAQYKDEVVKISGVGGCKVIPVWNGGGTVKLIIIASDWTVPTEVLINTVKELVDPVDHTGEGYGLAPIGHVVTVVGCVAETINITCDITYQTGWNWESVKPYVEQVVNGYFTELCQTWDNVDFVTVRTSQIEARLLNLEGIIDIENLKLNGNPANIQLASDQIPVKGTFNGS